MASVKLLIVEWCLEVFRAISIKFLNIKARIEADQYALTNEVIDMRTIPSSVKHGIIHNEDILKMRWDMCLDCEFLTDSNRCEKCGCFMKVKHKLAYASCPIGRWDRYNITDGKILNGTHATT